MMKKTKKLPLRRCVGCGAMKDKRDMVRIVAPTSGEINIDPTGKAPGRGAYICPSAECLAKAYTSHGLERSLKRNVPEQVYKDLQEQLA